jgi:hypothetical protein
MVLMVLPFSPRDAVNHGSLHFLAGFQNAEPDPVSIPTHVSSAVLSGLWAFWKISMPVVTRFVLALKCIIFAEHAAGSPSGSL